jgi:signal transduction histidine kinase
VIAARPNRMLGRSKETLLALLAAVVLLAMLTAFATELANTQQHNIAGVRARVHERGVLAGALIDGLFATASANTTQYTRLYGGRSVSAATLDRQLQTNAYMAVLAQNGAVLARSRGLSAAAAASLRDDLSVRLVQSGSPYGLGNVKPGPGGGVVDFSVLFATPYGPRILLSGFHPQVLNVFLGGDLHKVPRVRGAVNYVIDGNGAVLASTSPAAAPGSRFHGPIPAGARRSYSRDAGGRYIDEVKLNGSDWRIVLDSPDGPLYASVSGLSKWVPWIIFAAFALVSALAFVLVGKVFSAAEQTRSANQRLNQVNRELEQSNAMLAERAAELARSNEELDQFASIASHDLQEPLRKVRTFTEQLAKLEGDSLSDKGHDYVRRANAAAERMQTLIEDLLRFSRVSTHVNPAAEVDLQQVVAESLDDLSPVIEEAGAQVHVGRLPIVVGEPLQMRQLMQNLISNAIKFRDPDRRPEVWIDCQTAGEELQLTVRDNGIGFEPRYAGRIFRVFERLHGRTEYPGTGIGLALCRKIVERHGGSIVAAGRPGEGATFTVTLPRTRAGVAHLATSASAERRPALEEAHV